MPSTESLTLLVLIAQSALIGGQLYVYNKQRQLMAQQLQAFTDSEERTQRHNRLSVRPYLDFTSYADPDKVDFRLINHGLGVAIIVSLDVFVDGEPISGDGALDRARNMFRALDLGTQHFNPRLPLPAVNLPTVNAAVGAGSHIQLFDFQLGRSLPIGDIFKRIRMVAHYKSLYDEPDTATYDGSVA
jgi:hypothetical protein